MTKYEQLARMIEIGAPVFDKGLGKLFGILNHVWNNWSRIQSVIDTCEDTVDKMALDYLNYEYHGMPEPQWLVKMSDLA